MTNLLVQKYGGSSLSTIERIQHVAQKIMAARAMGHAVVVVVSAMYGETDRLIHLAHKITSHPDPREYDVLLSTGEQISIALLSMVLNHEGCAAISLTGAQAGIQTDPIHTNARILSVETARIHHELQQGRIVVIAGFQGINAKADITTLGRGGSDTTAVAIASALHASECQIYTDVDGVYTTDPHLIADARLIPRMHFEDMLEMATLGAKVLQKRAVEMAAAYQVPIRVLSTFTDGSGTLVSNQRTEAITPITGIAFHREAAMITAAWQEEASASALTGALKQQDVDVEIVPHALSPQVSFTMPRTEYKRAQHLIEAHCCKTASFATNLKVAKLSLIGAVIGKRADLLAKAEAALTTEKIAIHLTSSAANKISFLIDDTALDRCVCILHRLFQLEREPRVDRANA